MENLDEPGLHDLAEKISRRIDTLLQQQNSAYCDSRSYCIHEGDFNWEQRRDSVKVIAKEEYRKKYSDILIDCDWTASTREKYFLFLKKFKELNKELDLSVTLRLWQYKNSDLAGIPPANRCLLMCYNLSNPSEYGNKNTICSIDELKKYITGKEYPILLDVALPLFSSGVIFRDGKFKGMISEINPEDYSSDTASYKKEKDDLFMFRNDQVIGNTYIRYGDEIRLESLTSDNLKEISEYISDNVKLAKDSRVTFFSWNTNAIKKYGTKNIQDCYHSFGL
jgi:hypothetical protein